jgi:hypothetical protein
VGPEDWDEKNHRAGAISAFNGPEPVIVLADNTEGEVRAIADIRSALGTWA